jgi:hypothetical protein
VSATWSAERRWGSGSACCERGARKLIGGEGKGTWKQNTERGEGNHLGSVALQYSALGTLADMLCTTSIGVRRTKTLFRMRLHQEQVSCVCSSQIFFCYRNPRSITSFGGPSFSASIIANGDAVWSNDNNRRRWFLRL